MATAAERLGIVETKVENLNEKMDDLKGDLRGMHEELAADKKEIKDQLKKMYDASCEQHAQLGKKLNELEGFKSKWTYMFLGGLAVLGWITGHLDKILTFFK